MIAKPKLMTNWLSAKIQDIDKGTIIVLLDPFPFYSLCIIFYKINKFKPFFFFYPYFFNVEYYMFLSQY